MALQRDEQGFLVGDKLPTSEITGQLEAIHGELKAIRAALGSVSPSKTAPLLPPRGSDDGGPVPVVSPRQRGSSQNIDSRPAATPQRYREGSPRGTVINAAMTQLAPASRAVRDGSGRFVAHDVARGPFSTKSLTPTTGDGEALAIGRAVSDMGSRMADAVSELSAGNEEADPTVKAFTEVAQPLTRGFGKIFGEGGDDRKQDRWYRRFWREITRQGRDEREADKDSHRALKDIERAAAGEEEGGGGFSLAGIGGMLMKLPGMSLLVPAISSLLGFIRPLGPLIGKLALPVTAMFSAVKSFGTSTEEYAARMGVELNGSLAQALAVRFAGVLGDLGNMITFGLAGKLGELIAPYVSDMFETIGSAWDMAVGAFKKAGENISAAWDNTLAWFQGKWDGALGKVSEWIDGITNIGKTAKDAITKTATSVIDKAVDVREAAGSWVSDKTDQVAGAFGGGSKGRREAVQKEMLAAGITDPREQAMFMAQMDHESAGFRASEESFKYRSAEQVMAKSASARKQGKPAIEAAMKQGPEALAELMYGGRMGNTEKGDAHKYRGRGAIQLTGKNNYTAASKDLGIDLVNDPDLAADPEVAAKVATWFWKKNNIGEAARRGDVAAVTKRINGGTNGLDDRQRKYQAQLAASTAGTLSLSGDGVKPGSVGATAVPYATETPPLPLARDSAPAIAERFKQSEIAEFPRPSRSVTPAIGILPMQVSPAAPAAMAKPPSVPSVRTAGMVSIPEAPAIPMPLAADSGSSNPPQSRPLEVSRDVSDRRIAHVVTGAYSSMG